MVDSKHLKEILHGTFAVCVLTCSTILLSTPIVLIGLLKLFPNQRWKIYCSSFVDHLVTMWIGVNNWFLDTFHHVHWKITGLDSFTPDSWSLVVANHQSWLDIVVLHRLFTHKIPVLKFFIKDQLKWVPFLGFSWWAMGCPFMKRYSPAYLVKHPEKKGKDLEATQNALYLFKQTPSAIMNFVEGTRFTQEKKTKQDSPYAYLLKPKSGGISFVLRAMDQQITQLIDVTIVYAQAENSLWDFLCHRFHSIQVHVRQVPIPEAFLHDALDEAHMQTEFRNWLNQRWSEKDQLIGRMLADQPT